MTADRLPFTKGHGTENDFVLLYDPEGEIEMSAALVQALCHRRSGIGADGVLRAVRAGNLGDGSGLNPDLWFMDYRNADGGAAEMCGNGARVFALFLEREAGVDFSRPVPIGTRGGIRTVTALGGGRYSVEMGPWRLEADERAVEVRGWDSRPAAGVSLSNPHAVVALDSEADLASADLTAAPLVDPAPPSGVNVELVRTLDAAGERGRLRMRVHERGVGETRSCGTGACAAALAARAWAGDAAPRVWEVQVPGGLVVVTIEDDSVVLEGPAVLVADGVVDLSSITP